jgi:3-oxoacyl-[acyl-carrier protein] reductase
VSALAGKVALVTGAGKNIGRAIALALARDGAQVAVNGRADRAAVDEVVGAINALGGQAVGVMGDVAVPADAGRMVAETVAAFGGVDILICNAGLRRRTAFVEMSWEEWCEIRGVALDGTFLTARAAVPHMVARGGGAIVAMSGISTHSGMPFRAHVSAAKAGVEGLMRALAGELAPQGIRCNCVAPGTIDTARGASAGPNPHFDNVPMGRQGTVDEIAAVVRMLVGPEGGYMTGQTVHVNGGAYLA